MGDLDCRRGPKIRARKTLRGLVVSKWQIRPVGSVSKWMERTEGS